MLKLSWGLETLGDSWDEFIQSTWTFPYPSWFFSLYSWAGWERFEIPQTYPLRVFFDAYGWQCIRVSFMLSFSPSAYIYCYPFYSSWHQLLPFLASHFFIPYSALFDILYRTGRFPVTAGEMQPLKYGGAACRGAVRTRSNDARKRFIKRQR